MVDFRMKASGGDMHSHNRTLISSLGFADPDKKDSEHDLACEYLASPKTLDTIARRWLGEDFASQVEGRVKALEESKKPDDCRCPDGGGWRNVRSSWRFVVKPEVERPITKGSGQYASVVGFLDVHCPCKFRSEIAGDHHFKTMVKLTESERRQKAEDEFNEWAFKTLGSKIGRAYDIDYFYRNSSENEWRCQWNIGCDDQCAPALDTQIIVEVKVGQISICEVIRQMKFYREFVGPGLWILATPWEITQHDAGLLESASIRHVFLGQGYEAWKRDRERLSRRSSSSMDL